MDKKKNLKIVVACIAFLLLAFAIDKSSNNVADNTLMRNKTGDGDESVDLILNADGLDKNYKYQLDVKEAIPSEKQANELFEKAKEQIDKTFCEDDQTLEHVMGHVNMNDSYVSGSVEAEWNLSDYDIVDYEGNVLQEAFTGDEDETSGKLITASVSLSCGEYKQMYEFSFLVFPDKLDSGQRLIRDINRQLQKEMEQPGTKELVLPNEIDGKKLNWSKEKSSSVMKVALLEAVVIVLLFLSRKEKERNAIKDRNTKLQLEYPEIVSKMAVLMGSGMTVEQAWNRISAQYHDKRQKKEIPKRAIYEEMVITNYEIMDGESVKRAYQKFAERVDVGSYQRLIRILLQNLQTGSRGLCQLLEQEAESALEEKKALARKLGEEAGTRMLMPLMLMLGIVIAIIMVPAMMSFRL